MDERKLKIVESKIELIKNQNIENELNRDYYQQVVDGIEDPQTKAKAQGLIDNSNKLIEDGDRMLAYFEGLLE